MKKFSKLNESNIKVETSTNKQDFIKNLINETLSVENGEIEGKELLTTAFNKILEVNDSKTTIKVLENIKAASYHSLNFNWINEAIETEKEKMKKGDDECVNCGDDEDNKKYKVKKKEEESEEEMVKESKIQIEVEVKVKPEDGEEVSTLDEFEEPTEDLEEDEENIGMFVKESNNMSDIYNLMKTIGKITEEHHLSSKDERINFILSNLGSKKVEKFVVSKISDLPDYVKRADIDKTLRNMSDKEVEELYKGVEKEIGVKEHKTVELINEEHHLNSKKDQLDFIVANKENTKVKGYILKQIKNHPDFLKTNDVKKTLSKLSAKEIEDLYLGVEKEIGIK